MDKLVFALRNNSKINSSSGAAFPTIIDAINFNVSQKNKNSNLVVYGAAFDKDFHISHQRATTQDAYIKFRGSKYVQSDLNTSFQQVEKDLEQNKKVLFTGTPCQVAGLSKYLSLRKISTQNLYLVDIICHGTAEPRVWNEYVTWMEKKYHSKIKQFSFRYQKARWKEYPVMVEFVNGKRFVNTHKVRLYTRLFFSNLIMRKCCYSCKYCNLDRPSDITIGDFWGIEKVMEFFPYKNSVSQIIVNTEKGKSIIQTIQNISKTHPEIIISQCDSEDYLSYQHNLNKPTSMPKNREQFWEDYNNNGLEYVLRKYAGNNPKGMIRHIILRFLGETGLKNVINVLLH